MTIAEQHLDNHCLLCSSPFDEDAHLTGTKFINGEPMSYQLCRKCCSKQDNDAEFWGAPPNRKDIWEQVEKALMKKQKQNAS